MTGEERALWSACKRGDQTARARLVETNLRLVDATRRRACGQAPTWAIEDMEADGRVALLQAIDRFDPERGLDFKTFAIAKIRGAMLEWLRRDDWVPRALRRRARAGEEVQFWELVSLEAAREDEGMKHLVERIADPYAENADGTTQRILAEVVGRLAAALPRAERRVIRAVYWREETYDRIAAELGRSEARIHQLHRQAIGRLRSWLAPISEAYD